MINKIIENFSGAVGSKDFLALELIEKQIKLVHVREKKGSVSILNCACASFDEDDDRSFAQFLAETAKRFKVKNKEVISVLPTTAFISKNVDMPSNNEDEIAKIIELQAGRFTPYSTDEIVLDFLSHEVKGQHYTNVLLFIVHRKVIDRFFRITSLAGCMLNDIRIAAEGTAQHFMRARSIDASGGGVASIHIAEQSSDFLIMDNGEMVFIRSIPAGAEYLKSQKEEAEKEFTDELNKSLAAYQDQGVGSAIKSVFLSGVIADLRGFEETIKKAVPSFSESGISVETIDHVDGFVLESEAQATISQSQSTSYFDLMSCATQLSSVKLELTPKEIMARRKIREGGREIIKLGILIMTVFFVISLFLITKIHFKSEMVGKMEEINSATFQEGRLLERLSTKSRVVRSLLETRGKGLYVFEKITNLLGKEIYLVEFAYDKEGNLTLRGTADSMSRIFALVNILEESGYFETVTTNETKSRREGSNEVADFFIEGKLMEEI